VYPNVGVTIYWRTLDGGGGGFGDVISDVFEKSKPIQSPIDIIVVT